MPLTTAMIASLRTLVNTFLPETATISRNTPSADGYGGYTDSWATSSTVAARISERGLTPAEREIADQVQAPVTYTIRVPHGTDVDEKDRIVIGTRTFEVAGVLRISEEVDIIAVCTETTV